jgi:hypothetical protein
MNCKTMTIVSNKEFIANDDKYFDMAMNGQVFVQRDNIVFIVTQAGEKKKKRLKPDDELRRAITGDELLEGVYVSLDKFFAEK